MIEYCLCGAKATWVIQARHQDAKPSTPALVTGGSCDPHIAYITREIKDHAKLVSYGPFIIISLLELK